MLLRVLLNKSCARIKFNAKMSIDGVLDRTYATNLQKFPTKTYINGKWIDSASKQSYNIYNPANGSVLGTVPSCNSDDLNFAIESAKNAFEIWSQQTAEYRSKILKNLVQLHNENKKLIAEIITHENGKPLRDAMAETESSIKAYEWYAEECKRVYGDVIPAPVASRRFIVVKQPVGVCGFITPWNFPSSMMARKTSAALAAGCTVVIKPAEDTPYSALILCQLAEAAGLPAGCINVITTPRENASQLGKELCQHEDVRKISFTGSTNVGKIILENCAPFVKKTQMELGGNAPFIVFNSADLDKAVNGVMMSKFRCSGQTCICANRILVQEGVYDKFIEKLAVAMKEQLHVGDAFNEKTTQGPLINKKAVEKVSRLVEDSRKKGAKVLLGGKPHELGGNFYEPTLVTDVQLNMDIAQEEIFGPVASVIKFKNEEDAVRIANSAQVGLAGYFYSENLSQVWRVAEKLQVGMVGVNEAIISTIEAPFGGVKQSGFGYEGSKYGINEYLNNKYICMGNI